MNFVIPFYTMIYCAFLYIFSDHSVMKPRMKQMLQTIVNISVLMWVFGGESVKSDLRPNTVNENMKSHMIRWLKTMFPYENGSCESAESIYHDSCLKNNELHCGYDDQYRQPHYGDKKIRSIFYQVIRLQLLEYYF